jgi:hypothetical protein
MIHGQTMFTPLVDATYSTIKIAVMAEGSSPKYALSRGNRLGLSRFFSVGGILLCVKSCIVREWNAWKSEHFSVWPSSALISHRAGWLSQALLQGSLSSSKETVLFPQRIKAQLPLMWTWSAARSPFSVQTAVVPLLRTSRETGNPKIMAALEVLRRTMAAG